MRRFHFSGTSKFLGGVIVGAIVFSGTAIAFNDYVSDNTPENGYLLCANLKTKAVTFPNKLSCPSGTKALDMGAVTGVEGPEGEMGPQGFPGLTGSQGATGPKGADGMNSKSLIDSLIKIVEPATYMVECGTSYGSAFGIDVNLSSDAKAKGYVGTVVTNYHVIKNCVGGSVKVTQNKRNLGGYVWASDSKNDVALIMTLGVVNTLTPSTTKPVRGETVVAFGNPYGLEGSVSIGIISNLDEDSVITDAAIDSGNSGGPLVNSSGQFVGMNTWGWEGAQGSSHALSPGNFCRQILVCPANSNFLTWSR